MWPFGDDSLLNQIVFRSDHQNIIKKGCLLHKDLSLIWVSLKRKIVRSSFPPAFVSIFFISCHGNHAVRSEATSVDFVWGCTHQPAVEDGLDSWNHLCLSESGHVIALGNLYLEDCEVGHVASLTAIEQITIPYHSQSYLHHCSCSFIAVVASSGQNCRLGVWDLPRLVLLV